MKNERINKKYLDIFKNRIKQIRVNQNLTLEQASEKCSISPSFLSKLESGKRNPTFATLVNLSIGLDVPISLLVLSYYDSSELEKLINLFNKHDMNI